jgi:long-chain acyl-CoA synthetase
MTENLGISTVNFRGKVKIGTVGQAFKGMEVFLGDGDEVLVKGPTCTQGYYKEPEKTAELFEGGALHTGDCGSIDAEGYLTITGRIKDIFKTSKGKYVAPAPIENRLMISEHMAQVCVAGLDLAQPVALAVLTEDARTLAPSDVVKASEDLLAQVNQALPSHERMDKLFWVKEDWAVENGFLTPTLKIKRNVVEAHYKEAVYSKMDSDKKVLFLNA